jgi:DNA integrity scanning protein DisA with diadenylate cyclase activity
MNVSNINILKDSNRIIFNMNYNIEITYFDKVQRKEMNKFISDYVYWDSNNYKELIENLKTLQSLKYFDSTFIKQNADNGFINKYEISSVKFADKKYRVIFNLSHPVTFTDFDGNEKITSEFVYVNCSDQDQYNAYVNYVNIELSKN